MSLPQCSLGQTNLRVSPIGFGGAPIGIDGYLSPESRDAASFRKRAAEAVAAALEEGITLFDTAPGYGDGRSEQLLGEALAPHRDQIVLASKVKVMPGEGSEHWDQVLRTSLQRLRTGQLDLLQLHGANWTDELANWAIEGDLLDWLDGVKAKGLARAVGLTAEAPSGGLERLLHTGRFDVLQMAYSAIYQGACDYQREPFGVIPLAKSLGMGVLAMRTATSGVLQRMLLAEFPELDPARITRLAIRFVLSTPEVDCALVGMTSAAEVRANASLARNLETRLDLRQLHDFFEGRPRPAPTTTGTPAS
jgi:aryl-alcohol dehydrogenase-like predicted oxidoreductase